MAWHVGSNNGKRTLAMIVTEAVGALCAMHADTRRTSARNYSEKSQQSENYSFHSDHDMVISGYVRFLLPYRTHRRQLRNAFERHLTFKGDAKHHHRSTGKSIVSMLHTCHALLVIFIFFVKSIIVIICSFFWQQETSA